MSPDQQQSIGQVIGSPIRHIKALSGGDISSVYLLETHSERLLCKINAGPLAHEMFLAEKKGLMALQETNTIKCPSVFHCEQLQSGACLVMEFIESRSPTTKDMQKFGEQLAALHSVTATSFGWAEDNFIGSLGQSNRPNQSWVDFYVKERLMPQLEMARKKQLLYENDLVTGKRLKRCIEKYFLNIRPGLLHGDLWGGNYLITTKGEPCLIDPAIYYGDPMVDIAMSRLFGGFTNALYKAYEANVDKIEYYEEKVELYQLYYILVHLNLFGSSYYAQTRRLLDKYF